MEERNKDEKEHYPKFTRISYLYVAGMCLVLTVLAVSSQKGFWSTGAALIFGGLTTISIFYLYRQNDRSRNFRSALSAETDDQKVDEDHLYLTELEMNENTKEINSERDQFISIVSHELRTPLNAISGWTRILRNSQITDETREHALDVIEKNIRTQSRLVNELLDYSQVASDSVDKKEDEISYSSIFEKAVQRARTAAERKNISFEKQNLLESGKAVGDSKKLEKMFLNVLLNAVKFTPRGGKVSATIQKAGGKIRFRVVDSGVGIEDKNLSEIFEKFSQADSSTARKYGGFGLGLAFSKQVAALHNGEISADSAGKGKGSAFTVDLPIDETAIAK
ncbi:MAG: HAMP domain-containing sensor histidine kinase [Pyrinomonadaceae bacterium]